MKNLAKYLVPVAAAAIALVSCNKEINYTAPDANAVTIRVHASANELKADDPETKTYIGTYQGTPNTILWGTGEYMKLALGSGVGPFTSKDNTAFGNSKSTTADAWEDSDQAEFEFEITPKDETAESFTLMGFYPASAVVSSSNENASSYKVNLPATQNALPSSYDPAAYLMVAEPESFTSAPSDWVASFRRATALNKVTLKNLPEDIVSVEFSSASKDFAGRAHFDLTTGGFTNVYEGSETIKVSYSTALSGASIDVWFTSWNVEIASGEKLLIVAKSATKSYTREITANSNGIKFKVGFLNTLSVNMASATVDNLEDFSGNYLIAYKSAGEWIIMDPTFTIGTNKFYSGCSTGVNEAVADVEYSDFSGVSDIDDYIWVVEEYDSQYSIKSASTNQYLALTKQANEAHGATELSDNTKFDISIDATSKVATIESCSQSGRILKYNSSSPRFAFYTSGQQDIYLISATVDPRTPVTLSFAEDAINKTTANYSEFTGQTATASPSVSGITYAIDGDNIGTITAATGAVVLNGNTGSATVTASYAGDATYRPATASYTITVASSSETGWIETALSDITSSDVFVIVGNNGDNYALSNGNGTGSAPSAVSVTVSGTSLTGTIGDNIKWNISISADGYTFYPDGDSSIWLYCTNTNNGVRVGTNTAKTFTVDGGYLKHTGTSRYVGIYNSQDWRCYTSSGGNIANQTFKFYKYVDAPDNRDYAPISWSAASGTANMSALGVVYDLPTLSNTESLEVTYASSSESVATISNGTVTAVGAGTTTISATYDGSGNATYKTTTVSYELTVTDNRTACGTPTFSPAAGEVESGDEISISSSTVGATIYYTTGNSEFSAGDWTEYTAPVAVTAACTIKAIAVKANYLNSSVASATYTIAASASTIAQVLAGGAGTYTINNILVYAVLGNQAIVGDATGKMVLYKQGHGLEVGDNISIPAATVAEHNSILQIQDGTFNENSNGNAVDHGTATNLNDATVATSTLSTFSASGHHAAQYVTMNGTQSDRNITGTNAKLYLSAANTTYNGQAVTVTGYIYYYNSSYSNYNFQLVSIAPDESTPTISVSPSSLSWAAAETDSKTLTVTLNGGAAAGDYGYTVASGTATDWNISDNGSGTITVSPKAANNSTTDAKSITLRIAHATDSSVYQEVTCTQAKASSGSTKRYTLTLTATDIDAVGSATSGYGKYNGNHSKNAVAEDNSTYEVSFTTSQVMPNSGNIQFQASAGTLYNTNDLGSIVSISSGNDNLTVIIGSSQNPTSSVSGGGYFVVKKTSKGAATTSGITIVFDK